MRVTRHQDLTALAELTHPWLTREPFQTNELTTILDAQLAGHLVVRPKSSWLTVHGDHGDLEGVACGVPPRALPLSPMPSLRPKRPRSRSSTRSYPVWTGRVRRYGHSWRPMPGPPACALLGPSVSASTGSTG
jgi:hypothetical protein